jgi:hypothetical protein
VQPVYVREAYRLLQKSIIFIETEDVELGENEEEMDDIQLRKAGGGVGGDDTQDNGRGGGGISASSSSVQLPSTEPVAAGHHVPQQQQQQPADEGVEPALKKQKTKSAGTHVSSKEYEEYTQLIAYRLKQLEDTDSENFSGCLWGDLLAWFLSQVSFFLHICVGYNYMSLEC